MFKHKFIKLLMKIYISFHPLNSLNSNPRFIHCDMKHFIKICQLNEVERRICNLQGANFLPNWHKVQCFINVRQKSWTCFFFIVCPLRVVFLVIAVSRVSGAHSCVYEKIISWTFSDLKNITAVIFFNKD